MVRFHRSSVAALIAITVLSGAGCSSLNFEPQGEGYGTFTSSATAFTLVSYDLPAPALLVARGNAADSGQPNLLIEKEFVFPYLGRFDWILDILMIRYARVTGTWGTPTPGEEGEAASPGSN